MGKWFSHQMKVPFKLSTLEINMILLLTLNEVKLSWGIGKNILTVLDFHLHMMSASSFIVKHSSVENKGDCKSLSHGRCLQKGK